MTFKVSAPTNTAEVWRALSTLETLQDDVEIAGALLDLRIELAGRWTAAGIALQFVAPLSRLWFAWDTFIPRGTGIEPGVWLSPGDRVRLVQAKTAPADPALPAPERARAHAYVEVTTDLGTVSVHAEPITFAPPGAVEVGDNLVSPTFDELGGRVGRLAQTGSMASEAMRRFEVARERRTGMLRDLADGGMVVWDDTVIYNAFTEAAACGYALGIAEAEADVRPSRRKQANNQAAAARGAAKRRPEWWRTTATRLARQRHRHASSVAALAAQVLAYWPAEVNKPNSKRDDSPGQTQLKAHIKGMIDRGELSSFRNKSVRNTPKKS